MVLVGAGRVLVASRDPAGLLLMCLLPVFGLAFERSVDLPGFPRPAFGSKQASTDLIRSAFGGRLPATL